VGLLEDTGGDGFFVVAEVAEDGGAGAGILVGRVLDNDFSVRKEAKCLLAFLLDRGEVLAVLGTYISNNAYVRANNGFEALHLAGLANAGLEDSEGGFSGLNGLGELPDGEGDAYLAIVAFGGADDVVVIFEELVEPLFNDGFAVGAGDTDDGAGEAAADIGREGLEASDGVGCNEGGDAFGLESGDITMAIVFVGLDGEEEGMLGVGAQLTGVGKEVEDIDILVGREGDIADAF